MGPPITLSEPGEVDRRTLEALTLALAVFQLAVRCEGLVLNLNGRVPDEGGVFEAAVAFTLGVPVVLYKRDHRSLLHGEDNAMITGLSHDFSSVNKLKRLPGSQRMSEAFTATSTVIGVPSGSPARLLGEMLTLTLLVSEASGITGRK